MVREHTVGSLIKITRVVEMIAIHCDDSTTSSKTRLGSDTEHCRRHNEVELRARDSEILLVHGYLHSSQACLH